MVDDTNPYAVTASADQSTHLSAEHEVAARWLNLIGGIHAALGIWGLASSSLLLIGVYPGVGAATGLRLSSLVPSILFSAIGALGGLLLSRRQAAGWWLIGSLSIHIVIHQLMMAYLVLGPGLPVFRGQQVPPGIGSFVILRGAMGLTVIGYLSRGAVQRACGVWGAGRPINLLLVMLGGVTLVLVAAALQLL